VNYFYNGNQRGGWQSYPWMMNAIQELIAKVATLDTHRKHHERAPPPGIMLYQGETTMNGYRKKLNSGLLQLFAEERVDLVQKDMTCKYRFNYAERGVHAHHYSAGSMAVSNGHRELADYG
jgi:hypothetical protein